MRHAEPTPARVDPVAEQYEAFPYPPRDPADETKRLVTGSPSHPVEIDHMLFGGAHDWSQPFRALVAGGGTGDGLIMLAQKLSEIGCPAEITYLDLSTASRRIAEDRAAVRGLESIRFLTGDLTDAPELGAFDYIDCCGVLHHLPEPDRGFEALARALAPGGGLGLMVYAPHGRAGVYPLQSAFAALLGEMAPTARIGLARKVLGVLGADHPFARNPHLGDHRSSDAGLHDLLLNACDRPYTIDALMAALDRAGLELVAPVEPARYDPARYLPDDHELQDRVAGLDPAAQMTLAESLSGAMKAHVVYAARAGSRPRPAAAAPQAVPHLAGLDGGRLAAEIRRRGGLGVTLDGRRFPLRLPREAAPALALVDGRTPLGDIAQRLSLDWLRFVERWMPLERGLTGFGLLHYSRGARR